MARLAISARQLSVIERHAVNSQPGECCGILVGEPAGTDETSRVRRVLPAENTRRDRPSDRYAIDPRALLTAHKEARSRGLEVVGYYHSHPAGSARPSAVDRRTAWAETSYLILALAGGAVAERRSWRLSTDGSPFREEEILVVQEDRSWAAGASEAPVEP